jgi:hypothetical protein
VNAADLGKIKPVMFGSYMQSHLLLRIPEKNCSLTEIPIFNTRNDSFLSSRMRRLGQHRQIFSRFEIFGPQCLPASVTIDAPEFCSRSGPPAILLGDAALETNLNRTRRVQL